MKVTLTERFVRDVRNLAEERRAAVFDVILALPRAIGGTHSHSGLAVRKLHASGIWEARVGLDLRVVFTFRSEDLTLARLGNQWKETAREMAVSGEDWTDWDAVTTDGLRGLPWIPEPSQVRPER